MLINWFLNSKTGMAEWRITTAECNFYFQQPLDSFFKLVDGLHEACCSVKAMMQDGLDSKAAIAEWQRMIREEQESEAKEKSQLSCVLKDDKGNVVGETDRLYEVSGDEVMFDEVLVKGSIGDKVWYNGQSLAVVSIASQIGLLVDGRGARGPVMHGVRCKVVK